MGVRVSGAVAPALEVRFPAEVVRGSHRTPIGLAVISLNNDGDGLAHEARLLHRALTELGSGAPELLDLGIREPRPVPTRAQIGFAARLLRTQLTGRVEGWLFNHVGLARAQNWVPRRYRRPYAVMLNGIEAWDPALSPDRVASLRGASARIAISHHTARRVRAVHPEIGEIVACPLALLPERRAEGASDGALLERIGPRSAAIVGRMSSAERYKGHDQLLEAWPAVVAQVPDAQLVIVGQGDDVARLRAKAGELGIEERVLFTGFVTDATLTALLRRVRVFAMPSHGEGFGLVYLEAMRAGLPCIGSTEDAAGDIIVHGETGFLTGLGSVPELVGHLSSLLSDAELCARMGEAGRRRFDDEYTLDRFKQRLAPLLVRSFGSAGEI
jgi:phosphatidyl-myo-inositol dimannoside synthase